MVAGDGQVAARVKQRPLAHQVDHAAVVRLRAVHQPPHATFDGSAGAAARGVQRFFTPCFTLYKYLSRLHREKYTSHGDESAGRTRRRACRQTDTRSRKRAHERGRGRPARSRQGGRVCEERTRRNTWKSKSAGTPRWTAARPLFINFTATTSGIDSARTTARSLACLLRFPSSNKGSSYYLYYLLFIIFLFYFM